MLSHMDNGKMFPIRAVSHGRELRILKTRLERQGGLDLVTGYLQEQLEDEDSFSCATKFPMSNKPAWEGPLSKVFEAAGRDQTVAAYFLGLLVMEWIIASDIQWYSAKTNITKRTFETMYYWTIE
jgi:hypothetical protein